MNVFLSWSGASSKYFATALREWITNVLPAANTWMSLHDIAAGATWTKDIHEMLKVADFGILCLTSTNQNSTWLCYEAGALIIRLPAGHVVPFCVGFNAADIASPLNHLQGVPANEEGTRRLLRSLNEASSSPIADTRLSTIFDKWWPELKAKLGSGFRIAVENAVPIAVAERSSFSEEDDLDLTRAALLEAAAQHSGRMVVDLSEVKHIGSTPLGIFITLQRRCYKLNGKLVLVADGPLMEVLRVSKLDRYFTIATTQEEAMGLLSSQGES